MRIRVWLRVPPGMPQAVAEAAGAFVIATAVDPIGPAEPLAPKQPAQRSAPSYEA